MTRSDHLTTVRTLQKQGRVSSLHISFGFFQIYSWLKEQWETAERIVLFSSAQGFGFVLIKTGLCPRLLAVAQQNAALVLYIV